METKLTNPMKRPTLYYLVIHGTKIVIEEATDIEMWQRYSRGVRWHGVPAKTRAEAEQALREINASHGSET